MKKDARDFLNSELIYFQEAAKVQFTHFMQVFYFWTALVTAPITATLLADQKTLNSSVFLPGLLVLIAVLGLFLSAKMFDIRCSQLKYISITNDIRGSLYKDTEGLQDYKLPYPPGTDLRKEAFKDFGPWMAFAMSGVDAFYLGSGMDKLIAPNIFSRIFFIYFFVFVYFLIGVATYYLMIKTRGPKPQS